MRAETNSWNCTGSACRIDPSAPDILRDRTTRRPPRTVASPWQVHGAAQWTRSGVLAVFVPTTAADSHQLVQTWADSFVRSPPTSWPSLTNTSTPSWAPAASTNYPTFVGTP